MIELTEELEAFRAAREAVSRGATTLSEMRAEQVQIDRAVGLALLGRPGHPGEAGRPSGVRPRSWRRAKGPRGSCGWAPSTRRRCSKSPTAAAEARRDGGAGELDAGRSPRRPRRATTAKAPRPQRSAPISPPPAAPPTPPPPTASAARSWNARKSAEKPAGGWPQQADHPVQSASPAGASSAPPSR